VGCSHREGCDFLPPIDAPDGRFDHQELAGTSIPLELDTAHPYKRHPLEERFRQRLKNRAGLRSGSPARGGADIRGPDAELATRKGTQGGAVGSTVLQAKIKIAVGTLDPFLNDETLHHGGDAVADALSLRERGDFIGPRELGLGVVGGCSDGFDDAGKPQFRHVAQVPGVSDRYRAWYREAVLFRQLLKARLVDQ